MPHIRINEVGLRDGLQNQPRWVETSDKIRLALALQASGLRHLELSSFVSPKSVPQMADADALFAQLPANSGLSALVPNVRGLQRAAAAGVKTIAVVLSATDTMNQRNINMGLAQAQAVCEDTLAQAKALGMQCKAYVAVAFECPFEGKTDPAVVQQLSAAMFAAGADEVVIADTIGAANPSDVLSLMSKLVAWHGAQSLSIHLHDTRGMAVANAWAAMQTGITQFDSSLGGLGGCPFAPGAAGNLATEDLVVLAESCGYTTSVDLQKLRLATRFAESLVGFELGGRSEAWLKRQARLSPQMEQVN